MRAILISLVFALGCTGGGDSKPDPDPADVDAAPIADIDAPAQLPACTKAAYDRCTDNTQCTSGNCHLFMADGIQICTQACDAQNPCPDLDGQPAECNMKGICKPPGENACTPQ